MKASEEFKKGKDGIGYVSSDFLKHFGDIEFDEKIAGSFQKLPRSMNDAEIENELKPGICDLGDVLAFIKNPPEGTKDGWYNLFYTPAFVVRVRWRVDEWDVHVWRRDDYRWRDDDRVFSPATVSSVTQSSTLDPSGPLYLEQRIAELEQWKARVEKILKV